MFSIFCLVKIIILIYIKIYNYHNSFYWINSIIIFTFYLANWDKWQSSKIKNQIFKELKIYLLYLQQLYSKNKDDAEIVIILFILQWWIYQNSYIILSSKWLIKTFWDENNLHIVKNIWKILGLNKYHHFEYLFSDSKK